ncbi:MAG: IPTL-CTERM sorting domain-containing protein [Gammaproteobacteria bacterium]|nr:IPTL-CTERM sorting domain-containing protein [Gammaproteobacteria bacterium]NIQ10909.1 IPTL-CTERM sorting domain-containing protein [Gammaproteobacteria bacterium]
MTGYWVRTCRQWTVLSIGSSNPPGLNDWSLLLMSLAIGIPGLSRQSSRSYTPPVRRG